MNKGIHQIGLMLSLACVFVLISCKSQESSVKREGISLSDLNFKEVADSPLRDIKPDEKPPLPRPQDQLPPNSILFRAKVLDIKTEGSFEYKNGKCGITPCFATLQLEQIIQTGMGTVSTLRNQQSITVLFPNTLKGGTIGKSNYAPLQLNERIEALIIENESKAKWSVNGFDYTIIKYAKL